MIGLDTNTDPAVVRDALRYVSADCPRQDWVQVLMAVKAGLGDAGEDVAREWSMVADCYDERSFNSTWRSIKAEGGVGIGTLFDRARKGGWPGPPHHNGHRAPVDPLERWRLARGYSSVDCIRQMGASGHHGTVECSMFADGVAVGKVLRRADNSQFQDGKKTLFAKNSKHGLLLSQTIREEGIADTQEVILTEGFPDACAAVDCGASFVIGLPSDRPSNAVKRELQRLLAGFRGRVIYFIDPGETGSKSAEIIHRTLAGIGLRLLVVLPGNEDLNDRVRKESDRRAAFVQWIDEAVPASRVFPPEGTDPSEEKPVLELPGNGQTITDCARRLFERLALTHEWFLRGGRVVTLRVQDGTLTIANVTPEELRSVPEKFFRVFSRRMLNGDVVLKPAVMSREQAAAILECHDARGALPAVTGLSGCPLMLPDGRMLAGGFDRVTGIYVTSGRAVPVPTLLEAVERLNSLLADFCFVSDGDRARAFAALITPALRLGGFFRLCPVFVAEADQSQTGKGFLQKIVAAIYSEIPRIVAQRQGGVGSVDESLGGRLAEARPFIQLDNWRGKIDSPYLEALLTSDVAFPVRIPHRGEIMIDPGRFVLMLTSNSAEMTRDLANRSYIVRLRKQVDDYRFQKFHEGDLLDHVQADPGRYLGAVFAVVKHWIDSGQPTTESVQHDFRQWARALDWIVQNVFDAGPLMAGHEAAKSRLSDPSLAFVRSLAVAVIQTGGGDRDHSATELYELAEANTIPIPGLRDWNESQGPKRTGAAFRRVLADRDEVELDGFVIRASTKDMRRNDGTGYFKLSVYSFVDMRTAAVAQQTAVEPITQYRIAPFSKEYEPLLRSTAETDEWEYAEP